MQTANFLILYLGIACALDGGALAQQTTSETAPKPPAPATYTGCVMQSPNVATVYLLATADKCVVLRGEYDSANAAGHEVSFKGVLAEASGNKPLSLNVQSVLVIKDACSHTCTLAPPAHRGLGYQTTDPQQGDSNAKPSQFPKPGPHQ